MLAPKPDFSTRATSLERLLKLLLTLKDGCKCFLTLASYLEERLSQHSELSQHKAKKKRGMISREQDGGGKNVVGKKTQKKWGWIIGLQGLNVLMNLLNCLGRMEMLEALHLRDL